MYKRQLLGSHPDSTVGSIVWITIIIFATIAFAVYTFWVCLTLLSRQINKSHLATFGISIITSLIPVIILGILIGIDVYKRQIPRTGYSQGSTWMGSIFY